MKEIGSNDIRILLDRTSVDVGRFSTEPTKHAGSPVYPALLPFSAGVRGSTSGGSFRIASASGFDEMPRSTTGI